MNHPIKNITGEVYTSIQYLLQYCSVDLFQNIEPTIVQIQLNEDQVLFHEGDEVDGIYHIVSGAFKIVKQKLNDESQIIMMSGVGDTFGISAIFNQPILHYSAIAISPAVVCYIPKSTVMKIIEASPKNIMELMKRVNTSIDDIENHTTLVMTDDAETIVMKTFQCLKNKFGLDADGFINLSFPVKDLANYCCMSKTNLYRILSILKDNGTINYDLNRFKLIEY